MSNVIGFYLVMVAAAVVGTLAARRVVQGRERARQRVVEGPNSHYTSPLVRDAETRHRWQAIPLDRMHEINRVEVARLIARVEAAGVDALRPKERDFLDYMAKLASP